MATANNIGPGPVERNCQGSEDVQHRKGNNQKGYGLLRKMSVSSLLKKLRRSFLRDKDATAARVSTQYVEYVYDSTKSSRNGTAPAKHLVSVVSVEGDSIEFNGDIQYLKEGEESVAICLKGAELQRIGSAGTPVSTSSEDRLDIEPMELILEAEEKNAVLPTALQESSSELVIESVNTVARDEIRTFLQEGEERVAICLKGSTFRRIASAGTSVSTEPVELILENTHRNAVHSTAPQTSTPRAKRESGKLLRTGEKAMNVRRKFLGK